MKTKKILSLVLALSMILAVMPGLSITASAAGNVYYAQLYGCSGGGGNGYIQIGGTGGGGNNGNASQAPLQVGTTTSVNSGPLGSARAGAFSFTLPASEAAAAGNVTLSMNIQGWNNAQNGRQWSKLVAYETNNGTWTSSFSNTANLPEAINNDYTVAAGYWTDQIPDNTNGIVTIDVTTPVAHAVAANAALASPSDTITVSLRIEMAVRGMQITCSASDETQRPYLTITKNADVTVNYVTVAGTQIATETATAMVGDTFTVTNTVNDNYLIIEKTATEDGYIAELISSETKTVAESGTTVQVVVRPVYTIKSDNYFPDGEDGINSYTIGKGDNTNSIQPISGNGSVFWRSTDQVHSGNYSLKMNGVGWTSGQHDGWLGEKSLAMYADLSAQDNTGKKYYFAGNWRHSVGVGTEMTVATLSTVGDPSTMQGRTGSHGLSNGGWTSSSNVDGDAGLGKFECPTNTWTQLEYVLTADADTKGFCALFYYMCDAGQCFFDDFMLYEVEDYVEDTKTVYDFRGILSLPKSTKASLTLPATVTVDEDTASVTWSSSNTAVIANNGTYTSPAQMTEVTLTATLTYDELSTTEEFVVYAFPASRAGQRYITSEYAYTIGTQSLINGVAASFENNNHEWDITGWLAHTGQNTNIPIDLTWDNIVIPDGDHAYGSYWNDGIGGTNYCTILTYFPVSAGANYISFYAKAHEGSTGSYVYTYFTENNTYPVNSLPAGAKRADLTTDWVKYEYVYESDTNGYIAFLAYELNKWSNGNTYGVAFDDFELYKAEAYDIFKRVTVQYTLDGNVLEDYTASKVYNTEEATSAHFDAVAYTKNGMNYIYRAPAADYSEDRVVALVPDTNAGLTVGTSITDTADSLVYNTTSTNLIPNGSFTEGLFGWYNGQNGASTATVNGDGTVTIQNGGTNSEQALYRAWKIEQGKKYVFTYTSSESNQYHVLALTNSLDASNANETKVILGENGVAATTDIVGTNYYVFDNAEGYDYVRIQYRWAANNVVGNFGLYEVALDASANNSYTVKYIAGGTSIQPDETVYVSGSTNIMGYNGEVIYPNVEIPYFPGYVLTGKTVSGTTVTLNYAATNPGNFFDNVANDTKFVSLNMLGAHDAFTYGISSSGAKYDAAATKQGDSGSKNASTSTSTAVNMSRGQEKSAYELLEAGVRYFDIRLSRSDTTAKGGLLSTTTFPHTNGVFYTTHGLLSTEFRTILYTFGQWMKEHPGEVVVLDFQEAYDYMSTTGADGNSNAQTWRDIDALLTESGINSMVSTNNGTSLKNVTYGSLTDNGAHAGALVFGRATATNSGIGKFMLRGTTAQPFAGKLYSNYDKAYPNGDQSKSVKSIGSSFSADYIDAQVATLDMYNTGFNYDGGTERDTNGDHVIFFMARVMQAQSESSNLLNQASSDNSSLYTNLLSHPKWLTSLPIVMVNGVGRNTDNILALLKSCNAPQSVNVNYTVDGTTVATAQKDLMIGTLYTEDMYRLVNGNNKVYYYTNNYRTAPASCTSGSVEPVPYGAALSIPVTEVTDAVYTVRDGKLYSSASNIGTDPSNPAFAAYSWGNQYDRVAVAVLDVAADKDVYALGATQVRATSYDGTLDLSLFAVSLETLTSLDLGDTLAFDPLLVEANRVYYMETDVRDDQAEHAVKVILDADKIKAAAGESGKVVILGDSNNGLYAYNADMSITGASIPVLENNLGWNSDSKKFALIFGNTKAIDSGVSYGITFKGKDNVGEPADFNFVGNDKIGVLTSSTNRIYSATPWAQIDGVASKFYGTVSEASIYDLVTSALVAAANKSLAIADYKVQFVNRVLNDGGIYLVKSGSSFALTEETARIFEITAQDSSSVTIAVKSGLSDKIKLTSPNGMDSDGNTITVNVPEVWLNDGELFMLEAVEIEFVPDEIIETNVVGDVELDLDFSTVL